MTMSEYVKLNPKEALCKPYREPEFFTEDF